MQTMTDLRGEMIAVFDELRSGKLDVAHAKELSNAAGKIINSTRAQLEYAKLRKEQPNIPFMK